MSAATSESARPKRGDLIVIERIEREHVIGKGGSERHRFEVYEVAGLFRNGRLRTVRSVAWPSSHPEQVEGKYRILGLVGAHLIPAARIDKVRAIDAVRAHTYPNSTTPAPFDSIDEVRALLRPFVTDQKGSRA